MATQVEKKSTTYPGDGTSIGYWLSHPQPGEEVVISGLAGRFPESADIYALRDNLFNKVNMVTKENHRWELIHPEIPERSGKMPFLEKFDAGFFGLSQREANLLDPMCRLLLERVVEAIMDAGVHPSELEGTRTGIFNATAVSEGMRTLFRDDLGPNNHAILGVSRYTIPNRIAHYLKVKGPAYVLDTACSSSVYALEDAYRAIRKGEIDAAIVTGATATLHPYSPLQFSRMGVLSLDGASKTFDDRANGYARGENASAIFLQRAKDARRIYAKVIHATVNNDGFKDQGVTHPSADGQRTLMEKCYNECGLDPRLVEFVEAHGTGTTVGDKVEIGPLDEIFCKDRKKPLYLGSVKSNMGHAEHAAGLSQFAKAIISMEAGFLPPNLHFEHPRRDIEGLESGRIKVLTETTPFETGILALSSFGFGGANAHAVLKWNEKIKKNHGIPKDNLPRLVCVSGRVENCITSILDDVKSRNLDAEFISLLHKVYKYDFPTNKYRGFSVISKTEEITRSISTISEASRPELCLVFGRISEKLLTMGKDLLQFPIFADTIQRIEKLLLPASGVSLRDVFVDALNNNTQNNLREIVAGVAIQIGIYNILKSLDLVPIRMLGVSYGEFSSAYAKGFLSLEETIELLCNAIKKNQPPNKKDTKAVANGLPNGCPKIEEVNGVVSKRITTLKKEGKNSFTEDYFMQKLQDPNAEKDVIKKVPENCVMLEIGTSDLRTHLNEKTLGETENKYVQFPLKNTTDNGLVSWLETLGKLYEKGCNPDLEKLYPKVQYPVSRGTPMISPLIKWDHSRDWYILSFRAKDQPKNYEREVGVSVREKDWSFVTGHTIDGRVLFPATGYLYIVWETLALIYGKNVDEMQLVFENVKLLRATTISKDGDVKFTVTIQPGTGNFEVLEGTAVVVTGTIYTDLNLKDDQFNFPLPLSDEEEEKPFSIKEDDIYQELKLRGYNYSGLFRSMKKCNDEASLAYVEWKNNWVGFLDNMLQLRILQVQSRNLYVPTLIQRITIDAPRHQRYIKQWKDSQIPVTYCTKSCDLKCGGVEIKGLNANSITRRKPLGEPVLEKYVFVPNETSLSLEQSVRVNTQIALENSYRIKARTVELIDDHSDAIAEPLSSIIFGVLGDQPLIQADINILTKKSLTVDNVSVKDKSLESLNEVLLIVATNVSNRPELLQSAFNGILVENGSILSRESLTFDPKVITTKGIRILTVHTTPNEKFVLLTKRDKQEHIPTLINLKDSAENFEWLIKLQAAIKNQENVLLYSQNDLFNGILGLTKCIRKELGGDKTRCFIIRDEAPQFNIDAQFYREQLQKGFAINVYKNKTWGTYRHLLLEETEAVNNKHCFVNALNRGDLSSLKWIEGPVQSKNDLGLTEELVYPYYSALNFKDVMTATGRLQSNIATKKMECIQGLEYAGKDTTGRRVMGLAASGAIATQLATDRNLLLEIPPGWSLEDAATVPLVYATALYAMITRGNIKRGQSILIHAGSGGVGLAAIYIALYYRCNIFTTVGTQEKRTFIKKLFPSIKDSHIGNSRDTSFEQMVMRETKGKGVDIVLNSLAEESLKASVRCIAKGGSFLEIGRFDIANDNPLYLELFRREGSFHGINVDTFSNVEPSQQKLIIDLIRDGIKGGYVKPLPRVCFKEDQIEQAFRYMAAGKHVGKVLIVVREEEENRAALPKEKILKGVPKYYCDEDNSYVITGGLGGLGLELADWLVQRGAKKLVLASRTGLKTGYQAMRIRAWSMEGVIVKIATSDITTEKGCKELLECAVKLGDVAGIFNLAAILYDASLENQTPQNFVNCLGPKAVSAKYLDQISRQMCPNIKSFVVFSSVSCGKGNFGQTNYGMANAILERICEERKKDGLPALAVQWGAVGDVGIVAKMQQKDVQLTVGGTLPQNISSCLTVLDRFMKQKETIVSSMVVAEKRTVAGSADNVVDAVANVIGIRDLKTVSLHATLPELGMDSMMAVEVKQLLEREFEIFLTPQDVRAMTFTRLHEIMKEKASSNPESGEKTTKEADNTSKNVSDFENMVQCVGDQSSFQELMLKLPSMANESDNSQAVFMIPGIEGAAISMEILARNLNAPVLCLQHCGKHEAYSAEAIAKRLLPEMKKSISKDAQFVLVAHSYGCVIALEMVALLEKEGIKGKVFLVDGSPKMTVKLTKKRLGEQTGTKFETKLLELVLSNLMPAKDAIAMTEGLSNFNSFDDKIEAVIKRMPKNTKHNPEYIKDVIDGVYRRSALVVDYVPSFKVINSAIVVCKPSEVSVTMEEEDYGVSEFARGPVQVKQLEGNHVTMLGNPELKQAIEEAWYLK